MPVVESLVSGRVASRDAHASALGTQLMECTISVAALMRRAANQDHRAEATNAPEAFPMLWVLGRKSEVGAWVHPAFPPERCREQMRCGSEMEPERW